VLPAAAVVGRHQAMAVAAAQVVEAMPARGRAVGLEVLNGAAHPTQSILKLPEAVAGVVLYQPESEE
jgi:hypothetical protein